MTRRRALLLLLAGIVAVIGSCVPIGGALKQSFDPALARELALPAGATLAAAPVEVEADGRVRLALELDIETSSVQELVEGERRAFEGRYRFPFAYEVRASDGAVIQAGEHVLAWSGGRREGPRPSVRSTALGVDGGRIVVAFELPTFDAPPDGRIALDARLGPDAEYGAAVTGGRLRVYQGLSDYAVAVVAAIFMLVAGWIATVVGFVFVITTAAADGAQPAADDVPSREARQLAMICHLAGFAGLVIPFGNVLGPLVAWLVTRERALFADQQGREALNFQLTMLVYLLLAFALVLLLVGILMLPLLLLFQISMMILAAIRAERGVSFRYPLTIRFIR